jgi:hypothetical protein
VLAGKDRLLQCAGRIEQWRVAADRDRFLERADVKPEIRPSGGVGIDDDVLHFGCPETRQLRADDIAAWDEPEKLIHASLVGHRFLVASYRSLFARQRDGGAR